VAEQVPQDTLPGLLEEMRAAAENGDWESAHSHADGVLYRLALLLAEYLADEGCSGHRDEVRAILEAYNDVGKCYA
jgi:hypothetical protein